MGSCSSKPIEGPVPAEAPPVSKAVGTTQVAKLSKTPAAASTSSPNVKNKASRKDQHGSETEECESNPDHDRNHNNAQQGIYEVKLKDEANPSPTKKKSSKKLRIGYSSGGSSSNLDDDDGSPPPHRSTSCDHLVELKHSISVDGDLCKGVVRIETDYGRPIEEIYDDVHHGQVLGSGVSGIVRKVKHRKTGVNYAVKCLDLGLIVSEKGQQALREEVGIMCQLDHPNIVRLEEVYENESEIFLIQELCTGGDLFDRLDEQSDFHYSEWKCAKLVKQMLSAVRYLHSKNIIHRDLKLENFLFSSNHPESELKMIDFGLSKHFTHPGELQNETVGTPYTVAPEIINGQYDEKVDVWAMGVITYLLLSGETPFGGVDGESLHSVRDQILKGCIEFEPKDIWDHVSDDAKAFIKRLLEPKVSKRPTARDAQRDPWLLTYGKKDAENGNNLSPDLCQALVQFKEYSDMRKFLCEVLSFTLLPEQIAGLRKEFEKVDPDDEGEISLETLKQVLMESAEDGALGSLTETEVEDIFNALRVRKTETKIRWHEFIAAGLSQCTFDERNLKLAFDRLDYDRKGFITLEDMKGLLGTAADEDDKALRQMWEDGLDECSCPLGRITYDDFRMFIKGQKREREPNSPVPKQGSKRFVMEGTSPLQAVPEGSMSPQAKLQVFSKFDEMPQLLNLPTLGLPLESLMPPEKMTGKMAGKKEQVVNIGFPPDLPAKHVHRRVRSRSLGETPLGEGVYRFEEEERASEKMRMSFPCVVRPSKAIGELQHVICDESKSGREVHKALYRKHREFRQSVMVASKLFDLKRKARKLQLALEMSDSSEANTQAQTEQYNPGGGQGASLVMRRGSALLPVSEGKMEAKPDRQTKEEVVKDALPPSEEVVRDSDPHHSGKVADATKRSGRPRKPRQKTASDISGMLR